jgi:hypothetical protein
MNGPQSDTYNIMLASSGTTPLKIIYAGRLEYALCALTLQLLRGKREERQWRIWRRNDHLAHKLSARAREDGLGSTCVGG